MSNPGQAGRAVAGQRDSVRSVAAVFGGKGASSSALWE